MQPHYDQLFRWNYCLRCPSTISDARLFMQGMYPPNRTPNVIPMGDKQCRLECIDLIRAIEGQLNSSILSRYSYFDFDISKM